jgi:hypothetical protein
MKVIFLDFDGVVVCMPVEYDKTSTGRKVHALNRDAVSHLNAIVAATGAHVVVSSTWRIGRPRPHLLGYLRRAGFLGYVVDVTPELFEDQGRRVERGHEIQAWLAAHPGEIESYVVLDDDADKGPLPAERWVLVEQGWFKGGLTAEHAQSAIAALSVPA